MLKNLLDQKIIAALLILGSLMAAQSSFAVSCKIYSDYNRGGNEIAFRDGDTKQIRYSDGFGYTRTATNGLTGLPQRIEFTQIKSVAVAFRRGCEVTIITPSHGGARFPDDTQCTGTVSTQTTYNQNQNIETPTGCLGLEVTCSCN